MAFLVVDFDSFSATETALCVQANRLLHALCRLPPKDSLQYIGWEANFYGEIMTIHELQRSDSKARVHALVVSALLCYARSSSSSDHNVASIHVEDPEVLKSLQHRGNLCYSSFNTGLGHGTEHVWWTDLKPTRQPNEIRQRTSSSGDEPGESLGKRRRATPLPSHAVSPPEVAPQSASLLHKRVRFSDGSHVEDSPEVNGLDESSDESEDEPLAKSPSSKGSQSQSSSQRDIHSEKLEPRYLEDVGTPMVFTSLVTCIKCCSMGMECQFNLRVSYNCLVCTREGIPQRKFPQRANAAENGKKAVSKEGRMSQEDKTAVKNATRTLIAQRHSSAAKTNASSASTSTGAGGSKNAKVATPARQKAQNVQKGESDSKSAETGVSVPKAMVIDMMGELKIIRQRAEILQTRCEQLLG
ncbi:hypothetical protein EIP91_005374 [Steccherinum ochraceum]|uniref:Uncharacterized protein n=1 Tax=Steccherinum ochraceum TaxID=92696 RepID=A0A4R0RD95_9APHY|nr:hypothetical protein EIP91_005374 [Steccherinum ochraceum]